MQVIKSHCHIGALFCSEGLDIVGFNGCFRIFMLDMFTKYRVLFYPFSDHGRFITLKANVRCAEGNDKRDCYVATFTSRGDRGV